MMKPVEMPRVTRVEVIDSTGRAFVAYYEPGIEIHVQDDGRTAKIFAGERSDGLGREREAELEEAFQSRDWATVEHLLANPDAPPVGTPEKRECTCPTHPPATSRRETTRAPAALRAEAARAEASAAKVATIYPAAILACADAARCLADVIEYADRHAAFPPRGPLQGAVAWENIRRIARGEHT